MMKKLAISAALGCMVLSGAAFAQDAHQPRPDPFGDATVTRAAVQGQLAQAFLALDTNKDGFITTDELAAMGRRGAMLMRFGDTNKDGKISQDEFVAAQLRRFDMMDANHDGQLTKAERDAARAAMMARMQQRRAQRDAQGMGGGDGGPGGPGGPGGGDDN